MTDPTTPPGPDVAPGDAESGGIHFERPPGVAVYLPLRVDECTPPDEGALPLTVGEFEVAAHHLDPDGRLATGPVAAMADAIGGVTSGLAALPRWIVTTNLSVRRPRTTTALRPGDHLRFRAETLRRGRSAVVVGTRVTAPDDTTVVTSWITCAVLTPANGAPPIPRPLRRSILEPPDDPRFSSHPTEFFGLRSVPGSGAVALDIDAPLRNSWGILHGGAVAMAIDSAARRAADGGEELVATGSVMADALIHYLSPGRVGPVVATPTVVGRRGDETLVRVAVHDHGADDRPVALAVVGVVDDAGP